MATLRRGGDEFVADLARGSGSGWSPHFAGLRVCRHSRPEAPPMAPGVDVTAWCDRFYGPTHLRCGRCRGWTLIARDEAFASLALIAGVAVDP